ncbi:MAG: RagB/SusD family nutrient uptake outer membrane protein [Tannerellaceae bacterium]|nr:RagB/SusD family nutrient uptake outer membrane protein [Tannerellaceae bacterium]
MKKLIYLVAITAFFFSSCESFIETNNKSDVDSDSFYRTATGFSSLRNAAYSSLRNIYSNEPWLFEAGVDLYASGRNQLPNVGRYAGLTPQDSDVKAFYVRCYSGIQLANGVIYYSELTEENSNAAKYTAEAHFLRAFYHFLLVQQFGGVPIMDEYVNEAYFEYPRASIEDVYSFIISEMETAKANLPATDSGTGEITQQTVNHFLAKVYLTRGWDTNNTSDFTKAAEYAELAINGQGLNLTFEELFDPTNEVNEEVLWSVKYDEENVYDRQNDGNMQWAYFSSYLGGTETDHKYTASTLTPTWRMHEVFQEGDARYYTTYMLTLYESYWDFYYKNTSTVKVEFYYPTRFDVADTAAWRNENYEYRKDARIIPMTEETVTVSGQPTTYTEQAGSGGEVFGVPGFRKFDYTPEAGASTIIFSTRSSFRDVILARLGETYLIAAEAYLQAGNTAAAAEKINVVRNRAAMDGYNLAVTSADINIDFILDERARELAGEYHRWTDLRRTKKVMEYCMKYNPELAQLGEGIFGTNGGKALYRPIPQDAIDLNHSEVAQNSGY